MSKVKIVYGYLQPISHSLNQWKKRGFFACMLFSHSISMKWSQMQYLILFSSFCLSLLFLSIHSLLFSIFCLYVGLLSGSLDIQPNRILLVTIHHMLYPITVEVLHQVFSPHGFVEKIVTFQKSAGQLLQVFSSFPTSFFSLFFRG